MQDIDPTSLVLYSQDLDNQLALYDSVHNLVLFMAYQRRGKAWLVLRTSDGFQTQRVTEPVDRRSFEQTAAFLLGLTLGQVRSARPWTTASIGSLFHAELLRKPASRSWKEHFSKIRASLPPPIADALIKAIRQHRYDCMLTPALDWRWGIPDDDVMALTKWFATEQRDREHCDNFRAADSSRSNQVRRYYKVKNRGCCGFVDSTVQIGGKTYLVGFNYGH